MRNKYNPMRKGIFTIMSQTKSLTPMSPSQPNRNQSTCGSDFYGYENGNKSRKQFDGIGEDTPAQL